MTRTPIRLQDLRRRIYAKAKADTSWRFWGLYVHVCKRQTLHEAYTLAKKNDGAPGIDGVTFEVIEESGVDGFLDQIRDELATRRYRPMRTTWRPRATYTRALTSRSLRSWVGRPHTTWLITCGVSSGRSTWRATRR